MNKQPQFSIITICYNSSATIERTIKSVLAQSFTDYEYIIVDGGSKDSTLDIVKKYEPLFEGQMKWKSEPDKGIYDAMNKGIERSSGTIIGIVNSDDWLEADALENVYDCFVNNDRSEDYLYTGGILFHNQDGTTKKMMSNLQSFYKQAHLYIMSGIRHPATFVPKKVYDTIGLFDSQMRLSADQDFILRCHFNGVQFVAIEHVLSNMAAGGLSTSGDTKAKACSRNDRKLMLRKFSKSGLTYYWLYYSWRVRGIIRNVAMILGLYK